MFGHVRGAFADAVAAREGLFCRAHQGTLFLDEVGEIPTGCQAKLNRALELGEVRPVGADRKKLKVDVRVVAATLRDLGRMVQGGSFRLDLKARLMGETIHLPPLRQRKQDIPLLARYFLGQFHGGRRVRPGRSFFERLLVHDWPENVRSLRTAMMNVADLHPELLQPSARHISDDLVPRLPSAAPAVSLPASDVEPEEQATDRLVEQEDQLDRPMALARELVEQAGARGCNPAQLLVVPAAELRQWRRLLQTLELCGFNKRAAAARLAVDRSTVYRKLRKMKSLGLEPAPTQSRPKN